MIIEFDTPPFLGLIGSLSLINSHYGAVHMLHSSLVEVSVGWQTKYHMKHVQSTINGCVSIKCIEIAV